MLWWLLFCHKGVSYSYRWHNINSKKRSGHLTPKHQCVSLAFFRFQECWFTASLIWLWEELSLGRLGLGIEVDPEVWTKTSGGNEPCNHSLGLKPHDLCLNYRLVFILQQWSSPFISFNYSFFIYTMVLVIMARISESWGIPCKNMQSTVFGGSHIGWL